MVAALAWPAVPPAQLGMTQCSPATILREYCEFVHKTKQEWSMQTMGSFSAKFCKLCIVAKVVFSSDGIMQYFRKLCVNFAVVQAPQHYTHSYEHAHVGRCTHMCAYLPVWVSSLCLLPHLLEHLLRDLHTNPVEHFSHLFPSSTLEEIPLKNSPGVVVV